ncbi:hypothetical protein D3C86_1345120 [compost metagenome]
MSSGGDAGQGVVALRVENLDGRDGSAIRKVQLPACQEFVEKPCASIGHSGWGGAHVFRQDFFRDRQHDSLENQEVEIFVAKGEGQVVCNRLARLIALVVDRPGVVCFDVASDVMLGDDGRVS